MTEQQAEIIIRLLERQTEIGEECLLYHRTGAEDRKLTMERNLAHFDLDREFIDRKKD